jgi:hypothetical protein
MGGKNEHRSEKKSVPTVQQATRSEEGEPVYGSVGKLVGLDFYCPTGMVHPQIGTYFKV